VRASTSSTGILFTDLQFLLLEGSEDDEADMIVHIPGAHGPCGVAEGGKGFNSGDHRYPESIPIKTPSGEVPTHSDANSGTRLGNTVPSAGVYRVSFFPWDHAIYLLLLINDDISSENVYNAETIVLFAHDL
jgi:hypothetical protein